MGDAILDEPCTEFCETIRILSFVREQLPTHDQLKAHFSSFEDQLRHGYSLGSVAQVRNRPDCPFCLLVAQAISAETEDVSGDVKVVLPNDEHCFRLLYSSRIGPRLMFIANESRDILPEQGPFVARSFKGAVDHVALARSWLGKCEEHHGDRCRHIPKVLVSSGCSYLDTQLNSYGLKYPEGKPSWHMKLDDPALIRLLDIETGCLRHMPLETRYVALSYVAGQMPVFRLSKENFESLQVEGCLAEIRSDLPRTINDAIDFTKSLGERYIWVDALCLVHDDVHDVSFGVEIMNSIYQGAYFVIIAAAGTDSNSPLISGQPECFLSSRITTQLNTVVHMAAVQGLDWHLQHSVYRTRGWTLQEEVLSYRAVIFVNNQLYFRCRCANWSQETAADLKLTWLDPGDNNVARTTTLQDGNQAAWRAYQNLLEDYSNRQLILDGDAIRAASGILRVLTVGLDSWHLDGLPAYYLDLSLLWISTGGNMRRRPQFASYSWAGWAGGIKWPTENEAWAEESGEITRSTDNLRRWILEKTFVRWCCWDQGYSLETLFNDDYDKPSRFTRLVSEYAGSLPQHVIDGFEDQRFTENSVWSMCTGSSGFGMRPDFKDQGRCHPDGSPRIVTLFETELVNSQAEYDKFASRVVKPDDRTILYSAQRPTGCEKRMYRAHREDDDGNITGNRWAKNFIEYRSPDMLSTREIGEELEDFSEWKDKRYWCTQYGYNHELKEHNRPPLKMPDYPPYPLLHFHTISLKLRTGTPTGSSAHASGRVPGTPLLSEDGKLVGSLHLDNIAESAYAPGTEVELVLLSKCLLPTEGSTLPTNVERATENKAWDMFWVMHIVWKETAIAERRGIGQVLDVALTTACGAGPEDKYIMLA